VTSIVSFSRTVAWVNASYAASRHPVDFVTGQTSFSGSVIKKYHAHMIELGTLDLFVETQYIDFAFVLSMAAMGAFVFTLVARLSRADSVGRRLGVVGGLLVIIAATCDMTENVFALIMLADPMGFADWIAVPHSTVASAKFLALGLGVLAAGASLLLGVIGWLRRQPGWG